MRLFVEQVTVSGTHHGHTGGYEQSDPVRDQHRHQARNRAGLADGKGQRGPRIIGKTMGSACAVTPIKVKMSCRFRLAWETFTRTQLSGTTGSGRSPTASEAS